MMRSTCFSVGLAVWLVLVPSTSAQTADRDGDGIDDAAEAVLGTDPDYPESLQVILRDPTESSSKPGYDATKDVEQIEFCHVGDDRYLWRATLAAPPRLGDTVFHLYVDADADETTGRKVSPGAPNHGTDYMLSVVGGRSTASQYAPDGTRSNGPLVSFVARGNTLLLSADVELGRDANGIRYALYVLCHTTTEGSESQPRMSDSTAKTLIEGIPISNRAKQMRPRDYKENHLVQATFGDHLLQRVLRNEKTIEVRHDRLETDGFHVDQFTTRRWPHVSVDRPDARVWTTAPKPGHYHVGFMMYDDGNDERVVIAVDDQVRGVAVANQDNNTTWLYWLEQPIEFRGGERVELRAAGGSGKHGICNILFLADPPPPRGLEYAVEHMAFAQPHWLVRAEDPIAAQSSRTPRGNRVPAIVSWTTTWPCATKFEYGTDDSYGTVIEQPGNCLVHRVILGDLVPGTVYHGRAIGTGRDGTPYFGDDFVFIPKREEIATVKNRSMAVPLTVSNPHDMAAVGHPITTGIPFPQGTLASADHVRLLDPASNEVLRQARPIGWWPDGSVQWLLLSFLADAPANTTKSWKLVVDSQASRAAPDHVMVQRTSDGDLRIDTGRMRFRIDQHGNLGDVEVDGRSKLQDGESVHTAGRQGNSHWSTANSPAEIQVEEDGPVRAVIKITSHLVSEDNKPQMRIEKRIAAYRNSAQIRIWHTFVVDREDKFTDLDSLVYHVPVSAAAVSWQLPTANGDPIEWNATEGRVWQCFDNRYIVGERDEQREGRLIGSVISTDPAACAVAVRDGWQNYPKGFAIADSDMQIQLCPDFDSGLYDAFPFEKEGHQLYYYLRDGHYRLKRGVGKTHELLLCFDDPANRRAACALFQRPLLAVAPPQWYCESKAFYDVAPRDVEKFGKYEEAVDRNLAAYRERRERQHDFGLLNYGDWYGERGTNWGNVEYDTQFCFFLEFIRSGNPDAFFLGESTEWHNRDIDTVQWSDRPEEIGGVYVHQMCHVGEYYDRSVPGSLGFPRGGFTVSHAWVEGYFAHYFLTGDRRSWDTGRSVADFFVRKELGRPYDFSSTRTPGWHLIMLAAAYHATGDPYYLNAAHVVVDRVLATQDVEPRPLPEYQRDGRKPYQLGGWSRMMVPGHCQCEPRHRGNAGFMIAVLLSGLKYYYDVTGDERVREAIIRGAHYLLDETYSDEVHGFRYTSCPNTGYRPGATPLMSEGVARAYLWTKDERFRRVLAEALPLSSGGSTYGKGFSMYYRCGPRVLADLDAAGEDDLRPFAK